MTRAQEGLVVYAAVFVFLLSGFGVCIWLSGIERRSVELGLASFFSFILSTFFAWFASFVVGDRLFYDR